MRLHSTGVKVAGFTTLIVTLGLLAFHTDVDAPEIWSPAAPSRCERWRRSSLQDDGGSWKWNMKSLDDFFDYLDKPFAHCFSASPTGGFIVEQRNKVHMEGQKVLCLDAPFSLEPSKCRVFSFGVGMKRFDFELKMADSGCKVTIFDPEADRTVIEEMHKNFDMQPFRLGYEDKQEMRGAGSLHEWKRMSSIIDTIVITNETFQVDYLKLDVKHDQLNFLREITSKRSRTIARFKQINIKIKLGIKGTPSWADASRYYKYFLAMERKGYRLFSSTVDPVQHKRYVMPELNRIVYSHYDLVWGKCS